MKTSKFISGLLVCCCLQLIGIENDVPAEYAHYLNTDSNIDAYEEACAQVTYQKPSTTTIWFRNIGAKIVTFYMYCKKSIQRQYSSFKLWIMQKKHGTRKQDKPSA